MNRGRTSTGPSTPVKDCNSETNGSLKDLEECDQSSDCMETLSVSQDSKSGIDTPQTPSSPARSDASGKKTLKLVKHLKEKLEKKRDRSKKVKKMENEATPSPSNGLAVDTLDVCRFVTITNTF